MLLLITGAGILVFLHFAWPAFLRLAISRWPEIGGEFLGDKLYGVAAASVVLVFSILVWRNAQWGIWDTEPAVTAILATVAILYSYGQIIPSSYFPAFERDSDKKRISKVTVPVCKWTGVTLVVHNTGIVSWKSYRVSVETHARDEMTLRPTLGNTEVKPYNDGRAVQYQSSLLAVGEPSISDFEIHAKKAGRFKLRIRVATDLRPGERQNNSLVVLATANM